MSTQGESKLSRQIAQALRLDGHFVFKIHGGPTMMAGLPDLIVCAEGFFIGLETKMPDKRNNVSPRQVYVHDQITQSGGKVFVVTSVAEARAAVQSVLQS